VAQQEEADEERGGAKPSAAKLTKKIDEATITVFAVRSTIAFL
jgi:hypothetical protein